MKAANGIKTYPPGHGGSIPLTRSNRRAKEKGWLLGQPFGD